MSTEMRLDGTAIDNNFVALLFCRKIYGSSGTQAIFGQRVFVNRHVWLQKVPADEPVQPSPLVISLHQSTQTELMHTLKKELGYSGLFEAVNGTKNRYLLFIAKKELSFSPIRGLLARRNTCRLWLKRSCACASKAGDSGELVFIACFLLSDEPVSMDTNSGTSSIGDIGM